MSTDADRIAFTCPECGRTYGKTGRTKLGMATCCEEQSVRLIAEMSSKLVERDEWTHRLVEERVAAEADTAAERAAHGRTKAERDACVQSIADLQHELAEGEKEGEHALRQLDKALTERDAAQSERDSHLQRYMRTREHLDAAQAEAAAWKELHDRHCGSACCEGVEK